jgi:hypothetical protein
LISGFILSALGKAGILLAGDAKKKDPIGYNIAMPAFDTEIFPVSISHGQLAEELPEGCLITPSPRRCARGRSGELVFIALRPGSHASVRTADIDRIAAHASQAYFDTSGSVTAALRAAFSVANEDILPFTSASSIGSSIALNAVCAVIREGDIYLAYAGSVLAAMLRDGSLEQFPAEGDSPTRALGLSQNVDLRYGHTHLDGSMTMILAASPNPAWRAMPSPMSRLSLRAIGERMAQQTSAAEDAQGALLIRCVPMTSAAQTKVLPARPIITAPIVSPANPLTSRGNPAPAPEVAVPIRVPVKQAEPTPPSLNTTPVRSNDFEKARTESRIMIWDAADAFGRAVHSTLQATGAGLRRGLGGLLPRGAMPEGESFSIPPNLMLGTAIAIPLIVVAIVAVLYFRKGREIEFNQLMTDARSQISAASASPNRDAWVQALVALDHAAEFGTSEDLTALRNQAAHSIDSFDGIEPLEFHPALSGGLEAGTIVTSLLAGDRELYALDVTKGRVIRLVLGQNGYRPDETFICQAGGYPVGTPVGIAWMPDISVGGQKNGTSRGGAVVVVDSNGAVLFCPPGGKSVSGSLPSPRTGWISPVSIEIYNGRLYILDSGVPALWRFDYQSQESGFKSAPTDYFSPEKDHTILRDAVDFVVAEGEVFLLHADGRISHCRFDPLYSTGLNGSTGATLCSDLLYHDTRPGHTDSSSISDALFSQIIYNPPPEPTLFLLDAHGRGAFRFSMALNFLKRYRVTISAENQEASALAVGADKTLYIAIGRQIYYASVRTP